MIRLIVLRGEEPEVRLFADATLSLGSGPAADLVLADPAVAPLHCRIERIPGGYKIVDLDTTQGTAVNDEPVTQKRLRPGDRIALGATVIYFQRAPDRVEAQLRARRRAVPGPDPDELRRRLNEVLERYYQVLGEEGLAEAEQILQGHLERRGLGVTEQLLEREERLLRLQRINKALAEERDERRLLTLILDSAVELTGAERGFLLVRRARGKGLRVEAARNFDHEAVRKPAYKFSHSIAEEVARTGEPLIVADALRDERFLESMSVADLKLRSVICFPLRARGEVLGVLYLDNRFQPGRFGQREAEVLEMFADQAGIALRNARDLRDRREGAPSPPRKEEVVRHDGPGRATAEQAYQPRYRYEEIVGRSPPMLELFRQLDRVVPTEVPVLILGESGTGKELVARAIHRLGPRGNGPFVSENCAAIPETLLESELFGYVKGAFTGATGDKPGLFRLAHGGTLFLDEIGDMPLSLQAKLLRALERGEIRPVGSTRTERVDVRILAATHQDPEAMLAAGTFRQDLYYRLNVFTLRLPPLRERWEDIPLLVDHFLKQETGGRLTLADLPEAVLTRFLLYAWPGNVRELRNVVARLVALAGERLEEADVSLALELPSRSLKEILRDVEGRVIGQVLRSLRGRKSEAARALGISRPTLEARIETLGLQNALEEGLAPEQNGLQ